MTLTLQKKRAQKCSTTSRLLGKAKKGLPYLSDRTLSRVVLGKTLKCSTDEGARASQNPLTFYRRCLSWRTPLLRTSSCAHTAGSVSEGGKRWFSTGVRLLVNSVSSD